MDEAAGKSFHLPESFKHFLPDMEYQTEHVRIRLKVDLEAQTIAGDCTLKLTVSRSAGPVLHFDAVGLQVTIVEVDGSEVRYDHDGEVLSVHLGSGAQPGAAHTVRVEYSSKPARGVYFVHPEKEYPEKPLQAWTQFESEGARHCLPCRDSPDYMSTSEMILTVPEGFRTVSNGRLLSSESRDGWTTHHWREDAPHSMYLNSFAVGKFSEIDDTAEGVPLQYFFPEEKAKDALRYFGLTPDMLRTFVQLIGVGYPFGKYAQVAVHDYIYGGMENIGATTLTDTRFPDERSEEDYAARYSRPDKTHIELVSHELAHMWFGDLLTTREWSGSWLNEGFATYFEALYIERKFGVDDFRDDMRTKMELNLEDEEKKYSRAIVDNEYVFADDVFDSFVYEKGAWMLHQLRYILGDETFFEGIKHYVLRFKHRNVETHDLRRVMEEVSGRSLQQYFEQSFFRAGHPEFEVGYSWDEGARTATVSVKQTQPGSGAFVLPCDIVFYTKGKRRVAKGVLLTRREESFHFELESEPTIVEFDPQERLFKKVNFRKTLALLTDQLSLSQDASSRRRAAEGLAEFRNQKSAASLREAARKEQHWSVRAEALRSLSKIGGSEALEVLLEMATTRHRRVRRAAVAGLAEFRGDGRARDALEKALLSDESPYVQCEAALSLGKTGAADAPALLAQAMMLPSPQHGLTEAAIEAFGFLRTGESRGVVRAHLPYGNPTRVRIGALKAYIRLGSLEEEDLRSLKEIALKDRDFSVRAQLLETISELGERRFIETLGEVAKRDNDNRNRRRALELLRDFATGDDTREALEGMRREMEKLRERTAETAERLDKISSAG